MAENNLTTFITANADFSSLRTQLAAVTAQLVKLQETTVGTNAKLGNQIAVMNKAFSETLRSTGQFSTHFVTMSSDVQKFGKNLDSGQLKLNQYFKVWQGHTKNTGNLIRDLAKQQVMLEQAIVQPLGKNAQGMMQYNVQVAKGLDLIKNKTALARQEASIMNKVMMDGSNQLINWGKNTQWAGRQLTVGLTVPLAAFGMAAQKAFREADAELVRLTKVYGGLSQTSAADLAKVRKDISATAREIASAYGVAYKDTISLAADLAATGKQGNDLIQATQQTTRLAVLGEVDRQDAMKATLAIQNAFKQNTDELTQSIDFLNAVENQTSTSLADLTEAIPKAGPVVKALGGDVKDLALYLTAMKEGGVNAAEGANAIKSAMASLINPTKVATEQFASMGIDLKGIVTKNAGNLTETILSLQAALDNLDPLSKSKAIEQLFGKFQFARMSALFDNLGKSGSQTLQVMDLMKASVSDLAAISEREMKMMTESASGKFKRAWASVQADLAQVGSQFLKISTMVLNVVDGIVKFFDKLPGPIKSVLGLLGGLTAVAGPLIMLTGVLGNFVGYVIKGVFHLKSLLKGGQGFKLLTPEIVAAMEAGKGLQSTFYNDAEATNVLRSAVDTLTQSFANLESKANAAKVAMNPAITTVANSVIVPGRDGQRVVDKNNPLVGKPYSRQMAHMIPAGTQQMGSIFGVVPNPGPVNVRIGKNPQAYMGEDLPKIPGASSINGTSTGVVATEAAKWHAMTGALAMQSEAEIKVLKAEVAATGTITKELAESYQALLPEFNTITELAASETKVIVGELQASKITVDQARAKIIALNAEIEAMLASTATQVAGTMGRTVNLTTVPLTGQPAVTPTGKSNMKELFHKGPTANLVDKIAAALGGVKTSGAGYSIQTTKPKGLNAGGQVYNPGRDGNIVPGSTSIKFDNTPAVLHEGGFILNQDASKNNPDLVSVAKNSHNSGGKVVPALLTPGETYFPPEVAQGMMPTLEAANSGSKIQLRTVGGTIVPGKKNYGIKVNDSEMISSYAKFHTSEDWNPYARAGMIANDATALNTLGIPRAAAIEEANAWFNSRWARTVEANNGEFSQKIFDEITQGDYEAKQKELKKKYRLKKPLYKKVPNTGPGKQTLTRGEWAYGQTLSPEIKTERDLILQDMLKDNRFSSTAVGRIIGETKLPGTGPNQGVHRAHTSPGAEAKFSGFGFLGQATLQPHHINSLAMELSRYGIAPNKFSLDVNENKKMLDVSAKKLGYIDHKDMVKKISNAETVAARPPAMRTNKGLTTIAAKMLELKPAEFIKWMSMRGRPGSFAAVGHNAGGVVGGKVYRGKHSYGNKAPSWRSWVKDGVSPDLERAAKAQFAKYPNEQMPTTYNPAKPAGKFPMPKSYYQDIVNTDPLHGPLQIGKWQPSLHVRNRYVAPMVRYRGGQGYMKEATSPAFEIGTLETRAKSALFKYMQGDYSSINDPAVQEYLSTIRTKFTGTLHRGVRATESLPPVIRDLIHAGKWSELVGKEFIMRRSSWSKNKDTAEGFGKLQMTATVKNRNAVPASEIFPDLTFQSAKGPVKVNENEVYMGGKFRVVAASKNRLKLQAVIDGKREMGGPVSAGKSYLVGEKGPELFVPRNSGGIIPHYALGGKVKSGKNNYGLLSSGAGMGAGMVTSGILGGILGKTGIPGGEIIGQIAGWTAGAAAAEKLLARFGKTAAVAGEQAAEAGVKTGMFAKAGSLLPNVLKGTLFGISKLNIALAVGSTALAVGYGQWKKYKESQRLQTLSYGLTAEAAQKAGLRFKNYNQTIKDVLETSKALSVKNQGLYENIASSGTPLNLTISEYKKLRKEVKSTYADQIKLINETNSKDVGSVATRLKTEFMAAGMSAEDATKKIYAMISASNKQSQAGIATLGNKSFTDIEKPVDVGVAGVKQFDTASRLGNTESQAAALNTALQGIDTGIAGISAESEKAARAAGKTVDAAKIQADAIEQQMKAIGDGHQKVSNDLIAELAKTNPGIVEFASSQDTVLSLWQKIRIEANGFSGDLTQLNAKQVDALYRLQEAVNKGVAAANAAEGGVLYKQSKQLETDLAMREKLQKAAQGQSVQKQINARDAIAALQKQIDATNKLADARIKALDVAKTENDLANEMAKTKAKYEAALATGNTAEAQQQSLTMKGLQEQSQYNAQKKAIEDSAARINAPKQAKIEALQANQQKLADNAALAGAGLGKLNTKIDGEIKVIDAVNTAMAKLKRAMDDHKDDIKSFKTTDEYKGMISELSVALKGAGVVAPKGKEISTAEKLFGNMNAAFEKGIYANQVTILTNKLNGTDGKATADLSPANVKANASKPAVGSTVAVKDSKGKVTGVKTVTAAEGRNDFMPYPPPSGSQFHWNKFISGEQVTGHTDILYKTIKGVDGKYYDFSSGYGVPGRVYADKEKKKLLGFWSNLNALGALVAYKDGGLVTGQGTGTSDSILARLSNKEHIWSAKAVANWGAPTVDTLHQMARNGMPVPFGASSPSASTINLTQNIYPADGMNTDAFVRQVVQQTKAAIGQDAKMNAKMVGTTKNVSIRT